MASPLVSARGLRKEYPGVVAVDDVDFDLFPGEIVGLVGKNGAGKSSIIKMLAGATRPDAGAFLIDGEEVRIKNPHHASQLGLAFMHQELEQLPQMSVAENVALGSEVPRRAGVFIKWRSLYKSIASLLAELDDSIDPRAPVDELSVAQQRLIMIARALHRGSRVLVLDEPTASLTAEEIEQLHAICRRLRDNGGAIIYVSHRLDEIFALTDRVVVMRDGRETLSASTAGFDPATLIEAITGEASVLTASARREDRGVEKTVRGEELLTVRGIAREEGDPPVDFNLYAGEIHGVAGLVGAGRTELMRMLFGADPAHEGTIAIGGEEVQIKSPRDAIAHGIALLPEDRHGQGLIMNFSIRQNITLANLWSYCRRFSPFPSRSGEKAAAADAMSRLRVAARRPEQSVDSLSGGNQQKVVLGKWLEVNANILICDEPTNGIDVEVKEEFYRLMEDLAAQGKGVILVSSEFSELVGVCNRVSVMREGAIVAELEGEEITEKALVECCYAEVSNEEGGAAEALPGA